MAKRTETRPLIPSLLDRLIDDDPKRKAEAAAPSGQSLRDLMASVRRDLEWLLNSRRTIDPPRDTARETIRSVYNYGFIDITSRSLLSDRDQSDLLREMESAIALFEPRLKRVKIRLVPLAGGQTLHFAIEGLLQVDPVPQPVSFDAQLELGNRVYQVKGEDGAR